MNVALRTDGTYCEKGKFDFLPDLYWVQNAGLHPKLSCSIYPTW